MFGILALLWLFFGSLVCIFRPRHRANVYALTQMLRKAQWLLGVKVICRFDVDALRKMMPAVFVGNHQSNWDIVTMADVPQPGLVCVGKKSLIWAPIFGLLFYLSGNILIDRGNRSRTGGEFLEIVKKIKHNKLSLWIFPEGHRSKGKGLQKFKTGAVHTAKLANVPIIPFVTSSYYNQINLNRWDNGEIIIEMLPPLSTDNLDKKDIKKFTDDLRQKMLSRIKELDKEVRRPDGVPLPTYDEVKEEN